MSTALWLAAVLVALVFVLSLRLSVRLVARNADNGWDNALGYALFTFMLGFPIRWALGTHSLWLIAFLPLAAWLAQTWALRFIYQLGTGRAWLLGALHGLFAAVSISALTLTAGAIAAYVLYGKIVADPMWLVRVILDLLGIQLPF